jgi:hypothetical protein
VALGEGVGFREAKERAGLVEACEGRGCGFGIVGVDRETPGRTPKPSAWLLGGVARRNAFDPGAFR